jgi:hypothetical protein
MQERLNVDEGVAMIVRLLENEAHTTHAAMIVVMSLPKIRKPKTQYIPFPLHLFYAVCVLPPNIRIPASRTVQATIQL